MSKKRLGLKVLVAMVIVASLFFGVVACSGLPRVSVRNPQTDFDYVVRGNGTLAVEYGPYVYFVNGIRMSYEDPDADQNRWGDVVLGGIFRSRLHGERVAGGDNTPATFNTTPFQSTRDADVLYDFELIGDDDDRSLRFGARPDLDEEFLLREELFERVDRVDTTLIAPKYISTSQGQSGIFIFNEHIFFASPHYLRDGTGEVQYNRTDFFRMRLDGTGARRIFSTRGDSNELPFAFYYMGNNTVVLVAAAQNEDDLIDIVTVEMVGNRIGSPHFITRSATSVVLPIRNEFNRFANPFGLEDFIFYTRDVTMQDLQQQGNVIEVASPDGRERFSYHMTGTTTRLLDVRDDTLFYTSEGQEMISVRFTNLHNALIQPDPSNNDRIVSPRYEAWLEAGGVRGHIAGTVFTETTSRRFNEFTTHHFFRGSPFNNAAYMIGFASDGVFIISDGDSTFNEHNRFMISSTAISDWLFVDGDYLYFLEGATIFRVSIRQQHGERQRLTGDIDIVQNDGGFAAVVAGHLMFFARVDQWTRSGIGYAHMVNLNRIGYDAGDSSAVVRPFFMGTLREEDTPSDAQVEQYLRDGTGGNIDEDENGEEE